MPEYGHARRRLEVVSPPRSVRLIGGAAGVGFCLRLCFALINAGVPLTRDPGTDPGNYVDLATHIASGEGFVQRGSFSTYWPPLYPYFVAVWVKVQAFIGVGSLRFWIGFGQSVLAAGMIAGVGLLARRRVSPRVGITAAVVLAVWPNLVFGSAVVMTEGLTTPLYAFGVIAMTWHRRPRPWELAIAGTCFGAATLARPSLVGIIVVAAFVAYWSWRRVPVRAVTSVGLLVSTFFLTLTPWLIYSDVYTGRPINSSYSGFNLCQGHSDDATGEFDGSRCQLAPGDDAAEGYAAMRSEAIHWAATHPRREAELLFWRALRISEADFYSTYNLPAPDYGSPVPLVGLVVVAQIWWLGAIYWSIRGFWSRRNDGFYRAVALLWLAALVGPLLTFGHVRFHDAIIPFMAICVGARLEARRDRRLTRAAAPEPDPLALHP